MKPIQLVVPMSGQGHRYRQAGYDDPKPLITVSGEPMIQRVLGDYPAHWPCTFVMASNHESSELPGLLKRLRPGSTQIAIAPHQRGPGHAIEAALANGHLDWDAPVFVSYCDYGVVWDARAFERYVRDTDCDGCLTCYRGFHAHYLSPQMYAYARLDGDRVVEIREKGCFTDDRETEYASAGGYYFKSARLLAEALAAQHAQGLQLGGESYTSLSVEALLRARDDLQIRVFELDGFFQWGRPEDLRAFEYWEATYRAWNRFNALRDEVNQVLMPMAGRGSRFDGACAEPKPFIPIDGRPMYRAALASLPHSQRVVVVALEEAGVYDALLRPSSDDVLLDGATLKSVLLKETPPGQALSTAAGLDQLDDEGDIIVSACDHALAIDPVRWRAFREDPDCDAAIFTIRGFPRALENPTAYAWVQEETPPRSPQPKATARHSFPLVQGVRVKALPEQPFGDAQLLVGSFWFRRVGGLREGIRELEARDLRVNGEFYLDSIFDLLIASGQRVRLFELDGYIGWGDPDSLAEASYWHEMFCGRRRPQRPRLPRT
jgi:NDP-sugar pyrophosphorylase family protein